MTRLTDSLAARDAARTKHLAAGEALERARQVHKDADAEVTRLAGEEQRWISRHAGRLQAWIAEGSHGNAPSLAVDARSQAALASARAGAAAAGQALAGFEAATRESRQALAVAEAAVDQAVRAVLTAEGDLEAEEILRQEAALEARRNKLRGLRELVPPTVLVRRASPVAGDWLHVPVSELRAHGDGGPHDRLHTPLNKIGTAEVDPAAVEHWQARRASLLSGEELPPSSAPEERAA